MQSLAEDLYMSQDVFEKRFRRRVGSSPKKFSNIIRMRGILNRGLREKTFGDIAYEAGYFDQAHFNKDFKSFTGRTPTDFITSPAYW